MTTAAAVVEEELLLHASVELGRAGGEKRF